MRFHRKAHLRLKKGQIKPSSWRRMFYSSPRGRRIKRDANTANWINLPPLNRCDARSLNAQMNKKEFQGLMMLFLFVHFFPLAWWTFQKISRMEEKKISHNKAARRSRVCCHMLLQPAETKWRAMVEHSDRIKRWVEHIRLISGHAENNEGYTDIYIHVTRHVG